VAAGSLVASALLDDEAQVEAAPAEEVLHRSPGPGAVVRDAIAVQPLGDDVDRVLGKVVPEVPAPAGTEAPKSTTRGPVGAGGSGLPRLRVQGRRIDAVGIRDPGAGQGEEHPSRVAPDRCRKGFGGEVLALIARWRPSVGEEATESGCHARIVGLYLPT
jgi:hypothetical protein